MRFWDASAVAALCLREPHHADAAALVAEDPELVVWWGTPVECTSAFERARRDRRLTARSARRAEELLAVLAEAWTEVQPGQALRERARRLLRIHPLSAADALQLAAALEWDDAPNGAGFVTIDRRLRQAASREGFRVTP